jgi:hypothetical protein
VSVQVGRMSRGFGLFLECTGGIRSAVRERRNGLVGFFLVDSPVTANSSATTLDSSTKSTITILGQHTAHFCVKGERAYVFPVSRPTSVKNQRSNHTS